MIDNEKVEELMLTLEDKLDKTASVLREEYANIRAGRANPHILDKIQVDYYGTMSPINQVGNISVADAKCLVISPWDTSLLKGIEKAIKYAEWDKIELDADGKLKGASDHIKAVREEWAEYVTTTTTTGAKTSTPPANNGGTKLTKAEIYAKDEHGRYKLSTAERQKALAENPELLN